MSDLDPKEAARQQAAKEGGFYKHLISYVVVCSFLFLVNLFTSNGSWWFYWPMLGWGIGIFWHAVGVFAFQDFFGPSWEERRAERILKSRTRNEDQDSE